MPNVSSPEENWNFSSSEEIIKPHPLDVKYPHICFNCKRGLKFEELFHANKREINQGLIAGHHYSDLLKFDMPLYRSLKKLWRSQVVEFYCCKCFTDKKILDNYFHKSANEFFCT
ncbi:hypothetical protein LCGC14_1691830 [marine sediment metagenome]|uniref:Uncharacterized protein n=1 Tax=marine sediment metagenome TaxID=412755 RepID=A0A0F9HKI4_9ZZZZ